MTIAIRPAEARHLPAINDLVARAKRTWAYDEGYLALAIPMIQVDASYLDSHTCFAAWDGDQLTGFAAIEPAPDGFVLFWTISGCSPRCSDAESAQQLLERCRREAIDAPGLRIVSDPPAEAFYLHMGGVRVGQKPSRIPGGPIFPVLEPASGGHPLTPPLRPHKPCRSPGPPSGTPPRFAKTRNPCRAHFEDLDADDQPART